MAGTIIVGSRRIIGSGTRIYSRAWENNINARDNNSRVWDNISAWDNSIRVWDNNIRA